jgi:uroporphyrin-III C-methyltransferase
MKYPKLTLVGAGPGDAELITLKGVKALQLADVILYDALVSKSLLELVPQGTPCIFVGKRSGAHCLKQEEINKLIVSSAFSYGHVVRLKGGDPVVFGRGMEEMEYAEAFGIKTELISGISSCIAVPSSVGIPVTRRGISDSFWVMTGHTRNDGLPNDIYLAARSSATIVILMGLSKLKDIAEVFTGEGRVDLPVAVIQSGTTGDSCLVVGKAGDISAKLHLLKVGRPGVIVFGEVVRSHPEYIKEYSENLLNVKILV